MCSEMRETLTARLLSCKLAMSIPDVPGPAVEKIRAIYNLASDLTTPGTELTVKSGSARLDITADTADNTATLLPSIFALLCAPARSANVSLLIRSVDIRSLNT